MRTWSTLFGAPSADGETGAARAAVPGADAVQRGVEFAYRVSQEYMSQGAAVARTLSRPFASPNQAVAAGLGNGLPQLMERMVQYTAELSTMWSEALRLMPNGGFARTPPAAPARGPASAPVEGAAAPAAPPRKSGRLAIQVESRAPTVATLDLFADFTDAVVVEPLRIEGGGAGRISSAKVVPGEGDDAHLVVVRVPARQARGKYVGRILEAGTRRPVGNLTVRVSR